MQRKPIPAHRGSRSASDPEKRILQPCPAPLLSASASPSSLRTGAALRLGSGCRVTGRWRPAIPIARGTGASLGTSRSHVCSRCRQTFPTTEAGWANRARPIGVDKPGRSPESAASWSDQARRPAGQRPALEGAPRPPRAGTAGVAGTFRQFRSDGAACRRTREANFATIGRMTNRRNSHSATAPQGQGRNSLLTLTTRPRLLRSQPRFGLRPPVTSR